MHKFLICCVATILCLSVGNEISANESVFLIDRSKYEKSGVQQRHDQLQIFADACATELLAPKDSNLEDNQEVLSQILKTCDTLWEIGHKRERLLSLRLTQCIAYSLRHEITRDMHFDGGQDDNLDAPDDRDRIKILKQIVKEMRFDGEHRISELLRDNSSIASAVRKSGMDSKKITGGAGLDQIEGIEFDNIHGGMQVVIPTPKIPKPVIGKLLFVTLLSTIDLQADLDLLVDLNQHKVIPEESDQEYRWEALKAYINDNPRKRVISGAPCSIHNFDTLLRSSVLSPDVNLIKEEIIIAGLLWPYVSNLENIEGVSEDVIYILEELRADKDRFRDAPR